MNDDDVIYTLPDGREARIARQLAEKMEARAAKMTGRPLDVVRKINREANKKAELDELDDAAL